MKRGCECSSVTNTGGTAADWSFGSGNITSYPSGYDICQGCWDTSCPNHPLRRHRRPCERDFYPYYPYNPYPYQPWRVTW